MAKKSAMVRAGKAAKKAWKEHCRQEAEQQEALQKARTDRLLLSEFVPPCIKGLERYGDQDMATFDEVCARSYAPPGARSGLCFWPHRLGITNLQWFQHYWQQKLQECEQTTADSKQTEPANTTTISIAAEINKERLKAVISYIESLLKLAKDTPALPICRQDTHFQLNDTVRCFIPADCQFENWIQQTFVCGIVTRIAKNGTITVQLDDDIRVRSKDRLITYSNHTMSILRESEYQYLLTDSFYRRSWLDVSGATEAQSKQVERMDAIMTNQQIQSRIGDYEFVAAVLKNTGKM